MKRFLLYVAKSIWEMLLLGVIGGATVGVVVALVVMYILAKYPQLLNIGG